MRRRTYLSLTTAGALLASISHTIAGERVGGMPADVVVVGGGTGGVAAALVAAVATLTPNKCAGKLATFDLNGIILISDRVRIARQAWGKRDWLIFPRPWRNRELN